MKNSPFESVHEGMGAIFGEYKGWNLPKNYGNVNSEKKALRQNCAVFDLCAFGRIIIKGQQALDLINEVFAFNMTDLDDGKWIWAVICNVEGELVDKVRICRTGDSFMILTSPAKRQEVCRLTEKYATQKSLNNIDIDDVTEKTGMLGLYGPKALESVKSILPIDISGVEIGDIIKKTFFMIPLTMIRGSWVGVDGVELICPSSAAGLAAGAIAKYREKANLTLSGMECLTYAVIAAGEPIELNNHPSAEAAGPVELGLKDMVDIEKKFVGKTAVEKVLAGGTKSVLRGIKTESKGQTHESLRIQYDDKEIGLSDRISFCPELGCCIGLALINSEFADIDQEIQIIGDDIVAGGELVKLPF